MDDRCTLVKDHTAVWWKAFLVVNVLGYSEVYSMVKGQGSTELFPKIIRLLPGNLEDPSSFTIVASMNFRVNTIQCSAESTDEIYWMYKPDKDAAKWSKTLPDQMFYETYAENISTTMSSILSDKNSIASARRYEISGYYRCVATNKAGYRTFSPPCRLVYPRLVGSAVVAPMATSDLTGSIAVAGHPYRLPCLRDPSFNQGGYSIEPADLLDLPRVKISYEWKIRDYKKNTIYPIDLTSPSHQGRLAVHPKMGDLYFAYLVTGDQLKKGGMTPDGRAFTSQMYICEVLIADSTTPFLANMLNLTVEPSSSPSLASGIAYPTSEDERRVTCIDGAWCTVTCIFNGLYAVNGIVIINDSHNSIRNLPTRNSIVDFVSSKEDEGLWTCSLNDRDLTNELETVTFAVVVLQYPRLRLHESFKDKAVEKGSSVSYICESDNSLEQSISFLVDGQLVRNDHVITTYETPEPGKLILKDLNKSVTVACQAKNSIGMAYKAVSLYVLSETIVTQFPESGADYSFSADDELPIEFDFNCTFELDNRADESGVFVKWQVLSNYSELMYVNSTYPGIKLLESFTRLDGALTTFSRLRLEVNDATTESLSNTEWRCILNYSVTLTDSFIHVSSNYTRLISIPRNGSDRMNTTTATKQVCTGWIIVLFVASALLGIIIMAVICRFFYDCGRHMSEERTKNNKKDKEEEDRRHQEPKWDEKEVHFLIDVNL